jgi:rare lipoprotein A
MDRTQRLVLVGVVLATTSCTMIGSRERSSASSPPTSTAADVVALEAIPELVPRAEPPSLRGNMEEYDQSGGTYRVLDTSEGYDERGVASWYGEPFHGRQTSSGETYDMYAMTAAHRTLPLPSFVEVTNLANGQSVVLRVTDRGPFHDTDRRIIDVTYTAAVKLGMVGTGTAAVRVRALEPYQRRRAN